MSRKIKKEKGADPQPEESPVQISGRQKVISWAVFIPTLVVVFISLISIVFPALIIRTTSPLQDAIYKPDIVNPFQAGALAVPLVAVNVIILLIGIAYYKGGKGRDLFRKISNFEISQKRALIVLAIILIAFTGAMAGQLTTEETWDDYKDVKSRALEGSASSQFGKSFEPHVKYFLLYQSFKIFGNIRIIPFIASIALLGLTYFFTVKITQNRFAGIVSTLLLLQSGVFLTYSTSATYDNFWIILYLVSLYLIYKKWQPSSILYILSILSKSLTVWFLPMSIFFISRSDMPKKTKMYSLLSYGAVFILLIAALAALRVNYSGTTLGFDATDFWIGFTSIAMQMRFDYIVVLFLLPLTVMLFFASRKGILHADSIQIFMLSILLSAPFLIGFTTQTNQPYRFISLSVFFAIGVGILLSKRASAKVELSSK